MGKQDTRFRQKNKTKRNLTYKTDNDLINEDGHSSFYIMRPLKRAYCFLLTNGFEKIDIEPAGPLIAQRDGKANKKESASS